MASNEIIHSRHQDLEYSPIDEKKYCDVVLQLPDNLTGDDLDRIILEDARNLGLPTWEDQNHIDSNVSPSSTASTLPSILPTPAPSTSTELVDESSSSSATLSTNRMSLSAYSISSFSTCPTVCSHVDQRPRLSLSDQIFHRNSFDPGYRDRRFKIGLKHAISRLPTFRKRSSLAVASPSSNSSSGRNTPQLIHTQFDTSPLEVLTARKPRALATEDTISPTPTDDVALQRSLASSTLKEMRQIQKEQKRRHLDFKKAVMCSMSTRQKDLIQAREQLNQTTESALSVQHAAKCSRSEERDLMVEIGLVEEFEKEKQVLQIRIRHMEAYFVTPSPTSPDGEDNPYPGIYPRQFTDDQRIRLRQKQHELRNMDALHESKIKVLRGKQTKKHEETMKRFTSEKSRLKEENQQALRTLEKNYHDQWINTISGFEAKEKQLQRRWRLEEAIARKRLENESKLPFGPLPDIVFDDSRGDYSQTLHGTQHL